MNSTTNRYRAAKACRRCNQRRVKCDALEHGIPCTRCRQSDSSECVLGQSKRGTYQRKKARIDRPAQDQQPSTSPMAAITPIAQDVVVAMPPSSAEQTTQNSNIESVHNNVSRILTPSSQPNQGVEDRLPSLARSCDVSNDTERATVLPPASTSSVRSIPILAASAHSDLASPESNYTTTTSASSYREISWTTMFEHLIENRRRDRKGIIDKCSITYLGESFPLTIVLEDFKEGGKPRLHHPGPPLEATEPRAELSDKKEHPSHMLPEDISFLEAKQVFEYPADHILAALVSTFLDRVFPLYPIVNRQEFIHQYKTQQIPGILLHAVCFVAATYCPMAILHRAGFAGRKAARFSYYRRAKALFDTGYESNKIVILQSVILLTFWGGGPNNYWNFYSWIGTGVTIAETIGIHRSLADTNMDPQDRSLLKRLWWILVIRDASCGALVGRPFRINMDHSDTEMLTPEDFEYDSRSPEFAKHPLQQTYGLYQIHMSKLSLVLREIVTTRFNPGSILPSVSYLHDLLQTWKQAVPAEISWSDNAKNLNVFASCLSVIYNHHLILVHLRRSTPEAMATTSDNGSASLQLLPETAAQRISAVASTIVTRSHILLMPHETFQALFLAEVVFYTQMKSPISMVAQLGRMSLNNCQMVLHDAKEAWDPAPWVMKLFDNLIDNLKQDLPNNEIDVVFGDPFGTDAGLMGGLDMHMGHSNDFDSWQSNPMFSTLFDMSHDADLFPNQVC